MNPSILSVWDMLSVIFAKLENLGIKKLSLVSPTLQPVVLLNLIITNSSLTNTIIVSEIYIFSPNSISDSSSSEMYDFYAFNN
jgi:hypothetical protein